MNRHSPCTRCEVVCPSPTRGPGLLHLQFPLTHTLSKVLSMFAHAEWQYSEQNGIVSVTVCEDEALQVVQPIQKVLTAHEYADVRVVFQPDGKTMGLQEVFTVTTLPSYAAKLQSSWLVDMLREDRLTTAFQPIVDTSTSDHVFAYECLMRGQEAGQLVAPPRILEVARGADMLFQLDLAARLAAIKGAAKHRITSKIFINFNPTAIYDPAYCLRSTIKTLKELGLTNDQIVFEVVESDQVSDVAHLKNIINYYRKVGFEVALDDLGSGFSSLNMLHELRPDYVKLDMQLIRDVHQDPYKASITRKLLEAASELHIRTIAEGVECFEEYEWVRAHGADFVQGYFIAKPALVPPIPTLAGVLV